MARTRRSAAPARPAAAKPAAKSAPASTASAAPAKPTPVATSAHPPAPAPAAAAPVPAPAQSSGGSMMGGLMGTVAEGMAFGTGTAVARHAVDAVVNSFSGSDDKNPQQVAAPAAPATSAAVAAPASSFCLKDEQAFKDCLNSSANDISACQFYLDALTQCKQESSYASVL